MENEEENIELQTELSLILKRILKFGKDKIDFGL